MFKSFIFVAGTAETKLLPMLEKNLIFHVSLTNLLGMKDLF